MSKPKFPFIILVKFTTRGRKQRFFDGMNNIYELASQPDYIKVLVTADEDDAEMNNNEVKEFVSKFKNAEIIYGKSNNKIHAINRDLEQAGGWDIIANFSDDQKWTIYGWDDLIRIDMNSVFPETLDGYMAYLDPDTKGVLSTLLIAGRCFINRFGFIYDPKFQSLFCDNLVEDCAKHLGKYHYTGYSIYQHFNPSYGYKGFEQDEMYKEQQRIGWDVDQKLYYEIIGKGIDNYVKQFI